MVQSVRVSVSYQQNKIEHELVREDSLDSIVEAVCSRLGCPGPASNYCLVVESTQQAIRDSDLTRSEYNLAGTSLVVRVKPSVTAQVIVTQLQDADSAVRKKAIIEVKSLLKDESFARELLALNGVRHITAFIAESSGNTLAYSLSALQEAMSYGVGWQAVLNEEFVTQIVRLLDQNHSNINLCRSTLKILGYLANSNHPKFGFKGVHQAVCAATAAPAKPFATIVQLLASTDLNVQLSSLSLITSMLTYAPNNRVYKEFVSTLDDLHVNAALKHLLGPSLPEMKKQLYMYQRLRLRELRDKRMQLFDKENKDHEQMLTQLWSLTNPNETLDARVSEKWKSLGFQGTDPSTDFRGMGILGLFCLLYIAENYTDVWRGIVSAQNQRKDGRFYPVAVAGINVIQAVCDLLKVSEEDNLQQPVVYNVLFDHANAFEEIFVCALRLLDVSWEEMQASYMDFPKVLGVVRQRLGDALQRNPLTVDDLNRTVLTKEAASAGGRGGGESEDFPNEPEAMRKLRWTISQEMLRSVKQQRVSFALAGQWFRVYKPKVKQPAFMYAKLSENQQELLFGVGASAGEPVPELGQPVKISECVNVMCGLNSAIFSKQKKLSPQEEEIALNTFSLSLKDGKSVDFVALTRADYVHWSDALKVLISDELENHESVSEVATLANLQLRVQLLDLENLIPPDTPPKIPLPPANFHFSIV